MQLPKLAVMGDSKLVIEQVSTRLGLRKHGSLSQRSSVSSCGSRLLLGTSRAEAACMQIHLLAVLQMKCRWQVKALNLKPLHAQALALASAIPTVSYGHVKRDLNRQADALANKAVDTRGNDVFIAPSFDVAQDTVAAAFGLGSCLVAGSAAGLAS